MSRIDNSYDLEERTSRFGERVVSFCKGLKQDSVTKPIITQLVRSATSIGANYMEANAASSKRDFANRINICRREAKETLHWLRMIKICFSDKKEEIIVLWQECKELVLIFAKINSSLKKINAKI